MKRCGMTERQELENEFEKVVKLMTFLRRKSSCELSMSEQKLKTSELRGYLRKRRTYQVFKEDVRKISAVAQLFGDVYDGDRSGYRDFVHWKASCEEFGSQEFESLICLSMPKLNMLATNVRAMRNQYYYIIFMAVQLDVRAAVENHLKTSDESLKVVADRLDLMEV